MFSAQPRIGQYSGGEVAYCGVLPQVEEWQFHSRQDDMRMGFVRKPRRRCVFPTPEPDYKPHNGLGEKWDFEKSLAAPFDLSEIKG